MEGIYVGGKLQEISSVNTNVIRKEINQLSTKESEIQGKIDNHITIFLDCIRRRI